MARTVLFCCVLLGLAGAVLGSQWRPSLSDFQQEESLWAGANDNCRYFCSGDQKTPASSINGPLPADYECWGLFKKFCAGSASNGTEKITGSACQGHFKVITWSPPDKPDAKRVVLVCEGGHAWIGRRTATCPHTGKRYRKMMGFLSAGTTVSAMKVPSPSTPNADDASDTQQNIPLSPSAIPVAAVTHLEYLDASPYLTKLHATAVNADVFFHLEGRTHGYSVTWKATKQVPEDDADRFTSPAEWEDLDQEAKDVMGSSWLDWLLPSRSARHNTEDHEEPTLTCNDKPAWWHGAFPCWGNFSVSVSFHEGSRSCDKKAPKTTAGTTSEATRRGLRSSSILTLPVTRMKVQPAGPRVMAKESVKGKDVTAVMHAECDGFWSGWFGSSCRGVSTSHSEVFHADEQEPALDKWNICSGRQHLRFKKTQYSWGMAVECRGDAVMALSVRKIAPAEDQAKDKAAH